MTKTMFRKLLSAYGPVALAAAVLLLSAPRAVHAIAATLVQVTNTASNPAIAQSPNTQAAQLIRLTVPYLAPGVPADLTLNPLSNAYLSQTFTVPANQSLAITSVDITPQCASQTTVSFYGVSTKAWTVTGPNTTHFEYPSGLVIGPGITPSAFITGNEACPADFEVTGYLTSN